MAFLKGAGWELKELFAVTPGAAAVMILYHNNGEMMYLIFDTETTGLPQNWNAPITAVHNWPRMVQIAWILYDQTETELEASNYIIKPQGYVIPAAAQKVHGISTQQAINEGQELKKVLRTFLITLSKAQYLIAHNMAFDEKIVGAEFIRENIPYAEFNNIKKICTKELSTNYCRLPGNYGYKWPSLTELHQKLFQSPFQEAHHADTDVRACARCFFELKKKGVIKI